MVLEVMNLKKLDVTSAHLRMTCFRRRAVTRLLSIPLGEEQSNSSVQSEDSISKLLVSGSVALGQVSSTRPAHHFRRRNSSVVNLAYQLDIAQAVVGDLPVTPLAEFVIHPTAVNPLPL